MLDLDSANAATLHWAVLLASALTGLLIRACVALNPYSGMCADALVRCCTSLLILFLSRGKYAAKVWRFRMPATLAGNNLPHAYC